MPDFRPFPAVRYAAGCDLDAVLAPPYDVLSDADVAALHGRDAHNITHVDVPEGGDYQRAGRILRDWLDQGVLVADAGETLTIYRMSFVDASGAAREIVGVLGGLEVVDEPASIRTSYGNSGRRTTVLPHERTTPKATTDRLDLMRATAANTSPVWGLSLASGLTEALREPGEALGSVVVGGVVHAVERVSDPDRIAAIRAIIAADDVLIADGHHRYSVSRTYRDQVRAAGRTGTAAEQTLTFVNELIDDQLSIEAIHRLYAGVAPDVLRAGLAHCFDFEPLPAVVPATLAEMVRLGRLVVLWPDGSAEWLVPKPGAFDDVRGLDGVWLETALAGLAAGTLETAYQHGLPEMLSAVASGRHTAGILIRPTSIQEIRRTAREGLLMPPKSTFFTPKLLTGWLIRPTEPV